MAEREEGEEIDREREGGQIGRKEVIGTVHLSLIEMFIT